MWSGVLSIGVAAADMTVAAQLPGTPAKLTRRDRPEITDVRFEGAKSVNIGELSAVLVTQASHCRSLFLRPFCLLTKTPLFYQHNYLDRTELKRDVLRALIFYYKHGYRDAAVDTVLDPPSGTTVKITFRITENAPTRLAQFTIDSPPGVIKGLKPDDIRVRPGRPFDLFEMDSTVTNVSTRVHALGYANAAIDTIVRVVPPDSGQMAVDATIRVQPGKQIRVHDIKIEYQGDSDVSRETIRRSLTVHSGDLYITGKSSENRRALYQSGMFRRVTVQRVRDTVKINGVPVDTLTDVDVQVLQGPLHDLKAQVGFNTVEFVQLSTEFTAYNFLGGGRQLTVHAGLSNLFAPALNGKTPFEDVLAASGADQFGIDTRPFLQPNWAVGVDLVQPWFLAPQNSLGVGAFARRRSAPGVYVDYGYGANTSITRQIFDRTNLGLQYQFEITKTVAGEVYFCINFGICDSPTLKTLGSFQKLSPLSLSLNADHSNNQYYPVGYPTEGYTVKSELAHASQLTASDFRFNRATVDAAWYRALGVPRGVLALRARAGWVRPLSSTAHALGLPDEDQILSPRVRFYAGGANSVRGFGENLLGPRILTISPDSLRYKTVQYSTHITKVFVFCPPQDAIQTCNLNHAPIDYTDQFGKHAQAVLSDQEFTVRPLGGNDILEGSVEYRFPIKGALGAAAFVDGAIVGSGTGNENEPVHASGAITPGLGIRYYSSVGPIRIDLGLNPITTENLVVLTQTGIGPNAHLIEVSGLRAYAPAKTEASFAGFFQRVTLHLSIGQAF